MKLSLTILIYLRLPIFQLAFSSLVVSPPNKPFGPKPDNLSLSQ